MSTSLNPLEVYAEAGRKAGEAVNDCDLSRMRFHADWMRRACALESDQWARMARQAYDGAYRAAREAKL